MSVDVATYAVPALQAIGLPELPCVARIAPFDARRTSKKKQALPEPAPPLLATSKSKVTPETSIPAGSGASRSNSR